MLAKFKPKMTLFLLFVFGLIVPFVTSEVSPYFNQDYLSTYDAPKSLVIEATFRYRKLSETFSSYTVTQYLSKEFGSIRMDYVSTSKDEQFQIYYTNTSSTRYLVRDGQITALNWPESDAKVPSVIGNSNELSDFMLLLGPDRAFNSLVYSGELKDAGYETINGYNCSVLKVYSKDSFSGFFYTPLGNSPIVTGLGYTFPIQVALTGSLGESAPQSEVFIHISQVKSFTFPNTLQVSTILPPGLGDKSQFISSEDGFGFFSSEQNTIIMRDFFAKKEEKFSLSYDPNLRYARLEQENGKSSVFDYNLGVQYDFGIEKSGQSSCSINTINQKYNLFFKALQYSEKTYIGSMYCKTRQNIACKVFESYYYDYVVHDVHYDLIVAVHYTYNTHTISSLELYGYTTGKKQLQLALQLQWDFYYSETPNTFDGIEKEFNVRTCYPSPSQRLLLTAEYQEYRSNTSGDANKETSLVIKTRILYHLVKKVTYTRIAAFDIDWEGDKFKVNIMILDKPSYEKSFTISSVNLDVDSLQNSVRVKGMDKCFRMAVNDGHEKFIARKDGNNFICQMLPNEGKLPKYEGKTTCNLYQNSALYMRRLKMEYSLDFLKHASDLLPVIPYYQLNNSFLSQPLMDQTKGDIYLDKKIPFLQSIGHVKLKEIKTFSECSKACDSHKYLDCTGFSFCAEDKNNPPECVITSNINFDRELINAPKGLCTAQALSSLKFFDKINLGKYTFRSFMYTTAGDISKCAALCIKDNYCGGFVAENIGKVFSCKFTQNQDTDLVPNSRNVTHYRVKSDYVFNHKSYDLATEVFATYSEHSFRRCADLCYKSKYTQCLSFNYCSDNLCQLSNKKVTDQATNKSAACMNFERKIFPSKKDVAADRIQVASISKAGAFGTVIAFCIAGIIVGAGLMFLYSKSSYYQQGLSFSLASSGWQRHHDEQL